MTARALKLRQVRPKEVDIQSAVEQAFAHLVAHKKVSWYARINGGGTIVTGKGGKPRFLAFYRLFGFGKPMHKGITDILGQLPDGRIFLCEVKRPGEKTTPEQQALIDRCVEHGGVGFVAYGVEDVFKVIA